MSKKHLMGIALTASAIFGSAAQAVTFDIKITNLTHGMAFGSIMVIAHAEGGGVFAPGQAASAELRSLAEGNDVGPLTSRFNPTTTINTLIPTNNYLLPGSSLDAIDLVVSDTGHTHLSVVSMMVPTNDAFAGLNTISIPTTPGRYIYNLSAYDAGTEANDELFVSGGENPGTTGMFFSADFDPTGKTGTGGSNSFSMDVNTNIHVHRNVVGDDNPTGGISDLNNTVHRWLNPVMRVIVTVK